MKICTSQLFKADTETWSNTNANSAEDILHVPAIFKTVGNFFYYYQGYKRIDIGMEI